MAESWYKIGGRVLSFKSRPISFIVETIDGSDFTLTLENGESGTYSSGGTSTILYSGANSHPKFSFSNPLNIKQFETLDAVYIDNSQMGWLNIERIYCAGNSRGDFTDIGLLTSLAYLNLNSNLSTGNMSGASALTSLTYLFLIGNSFTGNMSGVSALTSLTNLRLTGNSFTGNMGGVSALTSLTYLYLQGSLFTGNMNGVSALTSLTYLFLVGNLFTGDMSGASQLPLVRYFYLSANFTINYTSKVFAPSSQRWLFRPTTATNPMSSTEIDQMLIDASQATWSGDRDVYADGNNGVRTSASDTAVANLQAMGVTLYLNV